MASEKNTEVKAAYIIMTAAVLAVVVPLLVFKNLISVFIIYHIGICLLMPFFDLMILRNMSLKKTLTYLGFESGDNKKPLISGFITGSLFFISMIISFYIFKDFFDQSSVEESLTRWGVDQNSKILIFTGMVIFNGAVEEVFWRGYVYAKLKVRLSKNTLIMIITVFYTSYHMATVFSFFGISFFSIAIIISVFFAGLIWGWQRYTYGSVFAPLIGHSLATAGYMTLYFLM